MLKWIIFCLGSELPNLKIMADSFDQALAEARLRDPRYSGGHVANDGDDE